MQAQVSLQGYKTVMHSLKQWVGCEHDKEISME